MFDVCLSFAGEDRPYVSKVAEALGRNGLSVFYDRDQTVSLWGTDLTVSLGEVYRTDSRFCVIFLSKHYARKPWANHERQHAMARQLDEKYSYILPARLDETEDILGLSSVVAYMDCRSLEPEQFARLVVQKISSTPTLISNEIFMLLALGEYGRVRLKLAETLARHRNRLLPEQISFALYNLACACSREASTAGMKQRERVPLLDISLSSLLDWLEHVKRTKIRDLEEAKLYVNADDDLRAGSARLNTSRPELSGLAAV